MFSVRSDPEENPRWNLAKARGTRIDDSAAEQMEFIEFTAQSKCPASIFPTDQKVRKGAAEAIKAMVKKNGGTIPADLDEIVEKDFRPWGTPLVVTADNVIYGVIYLKDTVKPGLAERFQRLREIGIKTIMCTGDNPLTAATIAKEAGVDGFIAECKPEDKIEAIRKEQAEGQAGRHDRRRNQRRAGAGAGRCGTCHEFRNRRCKGSSQYGGSGFGSHQDPGGCGNRKSSS